MGIIGKLISGKKGKFYVWLFVAVAIVAAAVFAYYVFNPGPQPAVQSPAAVGGEGASAAAAPVQPSSESSQSIPSLPPAKPLGNISFQSVKSDASINAIIDSSQKLDNGNLLVKFHHSSGKEEPVSVIGAVRYELSKAAAKLNEEIKELSKKSYVYV